MASSAYQASLTFGHHSISLLIRGVMAIAYMAIARGSPWVVPSVEEISPLPGMNIRTGYLYVFTSIWARGGHSTLML